MPEGPHARRCGLQLWLLDLDDPHVPAVVAEAQRSLDHNDCILLRQRRGDAALRFIMGRWLMRRALETATGLPADQFAFTIGPNGKPECAAATAQGLACNLSHSGRHLALAIGRTASVGLDIELVSRSAQALRIGRSFFLERHLLLELADEPAGNLALQFWTAREALAKAMGGTMWEILEGVRLDPASRIIWWSDICTPLGEQGWSVAVGPAEPGSMISVAVSEPHDFRHPIPIVNCFTRARFGEWSPTLVWQTQR